MFIYSSFCFSGELREDSLFKIFAVISFSDFFLKIFALLLHFSFARDYVVEAIKQNFVLTFDLFVVFACGAQIDFPWNYCIMLRKFPFATRDIFPLSVRRGEHETSTPSTAKTGAKVISHKKIRSLFCFLNYVN